MFRSFRNLTLQKRDAAALLLAAVLLVFALLEWWLLPMPLSLDRTVENPYFTTVDEKGNCYIVNHGKSEVLKINQDGRVAACLFSNNHEADSFSEANEIAVDKEGNIYILDVVWNDTGLGLAQERILQYDADGHFQNVVFEENYTDVMVMKRHLFSLDCLDGGICFAAVDATQGEFAVYKMRAGETEVKKAAQVVWEDAQEIQDISIHTESQIYFADKKGDIYVSDGRQVTELYAIPKQQYILPYHLACAPDGTLYFTDICNQDVYRFEKNRAVLCYDADGLSELTGIAVEQSILESIQIQEGSDGDILCLTCNGGSRMIHLQTGSCSGYDQVEYVGFFLVMLALRIAACIVTGVVFLYYMLVFLKYLIHHGTMAKKKFSLLLIVGVSLSALMVMTSMLRTFKSSYVHEQINHMCTVAQIASNMADAQTLEKICFPSDYGTDSYIELQRYMEKIIDVTSEYSENMYCNLSKMAGERCYAVAYLDNSIGAYYPLDQGEAREVRQVYETGERCINEGKQDATGSYVYVKEPILDSLGNVTGIVEVGMVSNILEGMVDKMRLSIMVEILLMLIIVVFFMNEGFAFFDDHKQWKQRKKVEGNRVFPVSYFRIITFLCFAAYNMPSSFLPVYMENFYRIGLPFSQEMSGSLPLTLNFAMIGIMSLFCAGMIRRLGFRHTTMAGASICIIGDISLAAGVDYWMVFVGLLLNGVGCGFLMNGLSVVVANQTIEDQKKGFSVMNGAALSGMISGTVIGAALAENIGKSKMFFFSAGIWGAILLLLFYVGKAFKMEEKAQPQLQNTIPFLFSRKILGFLLLVVVPYTVINGFTSYFLPVFGAAYGLGESQTSLLLVMNCLVGIFLSAALTDACMKYLGRMSIYLSSILSLGAVLLFAYFQNIYMLAFALFLLGIANSFGAATREIIFCKIKKVQDFGEDRAMGYYNLADNLGESLGTVVFGGIMAVGLISGLWLLSGVCAAMLGIYEVAAAEKKH